MQNKEDMAAKFHCMAHLYKAFFRFGIFFWADLASALVRMSQTIFLPKKFNDLLRNAETDANFKTAEKMPKSKEKSD